MRSKAQSTIQQDRPDLSGAAPRVRRLTLVFGPGREERLFRRLTEEPLTLGREPGAAGFELPGGQASRKHATVRYVPDYDLFRVEDLGSTNGTYLNGRRVDRELLRPGSVLRLGDCLLVYSEVPSDLPHLVDLGTDEGLTPSSLRLAHAEALADRAAPTGLPLLIVGPTGAGKERLAERLHAKSRRPGPLVAVNCAAFPRDMLASELFGHKKGAFTGALTDRVGLIAGSAGGTLFLDEIAELPLDQQPALLRVLQERKVRPVGGDREVPVDIRVVAATHRDLGRLEEEGSFREDLRARLEGVRIPLPGLADRPEEVLQLFADFLGSARGAAATPREALSLKAAEALLSYAWPKNVREIQQVANHVALFWEAPEPGPIPRHALPGFVLQASPSSSEERKAAPTREVLEQLLRTHKGNVTHVAAALGEHRTQVHRWLKAHGLEAEKYR